MLYGLDYSVYNRSTTMWVYNILRCRSNRLYLRLFNPSVLNRVERVSSIFIRSGFGGVRSCNTMVYRAISAEERKILKLWCLIRNCMSSSSPPHPQKTFENPLMEKKLSFVMAETPPKMDSYGNLNFKKYITIFIYLV